MSLFYEHQDGILCRKHVINAYFGYEKITVSDFYKFQDIYDIEYKKKFNIQVKFNNIEELKNKMNLIKNNLENNIIIEEIKQRNGKIYRS